MAILSCPTTSGSWWTIAPASLRRSRPPCRAEDQYQRPAAKARLPQGSSALCGHGRALPQFSVEGGPEENCAARLYAGASFRSADAGGIDRSVSGSKNLQISPLRYAPVEMTIHLGNDICVPKQNCHLNRSAAEWSRSCGSCCTSKSQNGMGLVRLFQGFDFTFVQADIERRERLIQVRHLAGADNG